MTVRLLACWGIVVMMALLCLHRMTTGHHPQMKTDEVICIRYSCLGFRRHVPQHSKPETCSGRVVDLAC